MDDLNGDGRIDEADAGWLETLIEELSAEGREGLPEGGLAAYGATREHGPFVHIDVRGTRARW